MLFRSSAGLPEPPKSACFFCPFHTLEHWRRLRKARPDLFDRAAAIETAMQERRHALGRDSVWMTDIGARDKVKLIDLVTTDQLSLDDPSDNCDSGWCMT